MEIITDQSLNTANKDLWTRAKKAVDTQNYDYALTLLQALLKTEPGFLDGRRLLRASAIKKFRNQSSFSKSMLGITTSGKLMSAGGKKEPAEKLAAAEEVLAVDPFNKKANTMIVEVGEALEIDEFVTFGLETIADGDPKDNANLTRLGKFYQSIGEFEKAIKTFDRMLATDPHNAEALSLRKGAEAAQSSHSFQKKDWRKSIHNEDKAVERQQADRSFKEEDQAHAEIARLNERLEAEPDNRVIPKQIAKLYAQAEDYESALEWYNYALQQAGGSDQSLSKIIDDLSLKQNQIALDAWRERLEANPDDEEAKTNVEAAEAERTQLVISTYEKRVEQYPNDYQFQYDLGKAYYDAGMYKEALPKLQLGMKQPSVRPNAQLYIALCYVQRKMYDLAAKALVTAKEERQTMDDLKKDIIYHLGKTYEAMGEKAKGVEQAKEIYEVDMGYRDVAEWVERSYSEEG